ncbi:MAG: 2-C-methyl-D-erythritol 4-phosphate cytidylyltransferase [Nocardioidaceae bacterium]|nr:2-C-methyl-D-erythritol 4-phosphate cytidylyltransferase [Nocardioidaceae bacterium]
MSVAALVPAAGRGERLGGDVCKALREVRGEPLVVHAVRSLQASTDVALVVIAAPAGHVDRFEAVLGAAGSGSRGAGRLRPVWLVVSGAETRQGSVARALAALSCADDVEIVLVHDAARCLVPVEVVRRVVAAVRAGADAVVPVVPLVDTVKQVDGDQITATIDRDRLRQVQTPQGFRRDVLVRAYAAAGAHQAGDDAGLVERIGGNVRVVAGHAEAFKVTGPLDLLVADAVLRTRTP